MHIWLPDHDKLAFFCAKFNIKSDSCSKIAMAIGIDYTTQLKPRIKDYSYKFKGDNSRVGAGRKEDETIEIFKNFTVTELHNEFANILLKFNLKHDNLINNEFSPRSRKSGYSNNSWSNNQLLLPYIASRFDIEEKNIRMQLADIINLKIEGFDGKFYGFNYLKGKGRNDDTTSDMKELFTEFSKKTNQEVLSEVESIYPEFKKFESFFLDQVDEITALEGMIFESKELGHSRNRKLAEDCKRRDGYSCQACGFKLYINGYYVIDCHHKNPLSTNNPKITSVDELVSLCPRCHRISHTVSPPFELNKLKEVLLMYQVIISE